MIITPEIINKGGAANLVLICDHASNFIPEDYASLGLSDDLLKTHIAWDIGAEALTRRLSKKLDAPAVLARHSRLLIDTNREVGDDTQILAKSDGVDIPGNQGLEMAGRLQRIKNFYLPFHETADALVASRLESHPCIIGVHTFTRVYGGIGRDLEIAVMWHDDNRLATLFGKIFEAKGFKVGWNEPYSGEISFYSMDRHGGDNNLPHLTVEVRQDLVETKTGQKKFAAVIADAYAEIKGF